MIYKTIFRVLKSAKIANINSILSLVMSIVAFCVLAKMSQEFSILKMSSHQKFFAKAEDNVVDIKAENLEENKEEQEVSFQIEKIVSEKSKESKQAVSVKKIPEKPKDIKLEVKKEKTEKKTDKVEKKEVKKEDKNAATTIKVEQAKSQTIKNDVKKIVGKVVEKVTEKKDIAKPVIEEKWSVQIGAFKDPKNAISVCGDILKEHSLSQKCVTANGINDLKKVLISEFVKKEDASSLCAKLKASKKISCKIVALK